MLRYFDRSGNPITPEQWGTTLETERRVAETTLPDGRWVSTILLGLDHNFGSGPPLIFETMVFQTHGEWSELDQARYATLAEAEAGHALMVSKYTPLTVQGGRAIKED